MGPRLESALDVDPCGLTGAAFPHLTIRSAILHQIDTRPGATSGIRSCQWMLGRTSSYLRSNEFSQRLYT